MRKPPEGAAFSLLNHVRPYRAAALRRYSGGREPLIETDYGLEGGVAAQSSMKRLWQEGICVLNSPRCLTRKFPASLSVLLLSHPSRERRTSADITPARPSPPWQCTRSGQLAGLEATSRNCFACSAVGA